MASKRFDIPLTTLGDHVKRGVTRIGAGAPTVLTKEEEREVVATTQVLQQMGFGLTKELVGIVIKDYLDNQPFRPNPFKDGLPGRDWWTRFLKRWESQLSVHKPQHLPTHRAASANEEVLSSWFERVLDVFKKTGLDALPEGDLQKYLWNCDETGFCTSVAMKKILAKRGEKDVHETLGGSGRDYITVLGAGCADGTRLPPFVVYKGKNLWARWMVGGPAGAMFSVSDSGWMEGANFIQWFKQMFLPAVRGLTVEKPVILFFDGHHSHLTIELIKTARDNNVHMICFPPHCTHVMQPLDVSVYSAVKTAWRKVLKEHQLTTCAAVVTKEDFPALLLRLWELSFKPEHLKNGFIKCGLCPLNKDAIPASKLCKAEPLKGPHKDPSHEATVRPTASSGTSEAVRPTASSGTSEAETYSTDPVEIVVNLTGKCQVNTFVTPIKLHLRGYFAKILHKNKETRKRTENKQKIKPQFYGEALTTDDFFERVREEEKRKKEAEQKKQESRKARSAASKRKQSKARRQSKGKYSPRKVSARSKRVVQETSPATETEDSEGTTDDGVCEECGGCYKDESVRVRKTWIGCDNCERWFHYTCIGLSEIPPGHWSCQYC